MKFTSGVLFGFFLLVVGARLAYAQSQALQNVIVVIQENRTPDNLFQDRTRLLSPLAPTLLPSVPAESVATCRFL